MTAQERSTRSFADLIEKEDFINHKSDNRLFHDISIRIAKLINIVLMTVPFAVTWYTYFADKLLGAFYMRGHWLVVGLFVFLFFYNAIKVKGDRSIVRTTERNPFIYTVFRGLSQQI